MLSSCQIQINGDLSPHRNLQQCSDSPPQLSATEKCPNNTKILTQEQQKTPKAAVSTKLLSVLLYLRKKFLFDIAKMTFIRLNLTHKLFKIQMLNLNLYLIFSNNYSLLILPYVVSLLQNKLQ